MFRFRKSRKQANSIEASQFDLSHNIGCLVCLMEPDDDDNAGVFYQLKFLPINSHNGIFEKCSQIYEYSSLPPPQKKSTG